MPYRKTKTHKNTQAAFNKLKKQFTFKYIDNDDTCSVRAIALALNEPYNVIKEDVGDACSMLIYFNKYMHLIGCFDGRIVHDLTYDDFYHVFYNNTVLIVIDKHVFTVKNMVILDNYNWLQHDQEIKSYYILEKDKVPHPYKWVVRIS